MAHIDSLNPSASRLDQLMAHYEESHRHPTNEAIHLVAVPLIMLSLVGLLYVLHPVVALVFVGASCVYYLRLLSARQLVFMVALSAAMLYGVHLMGEQRLVLCVGIFVVSWIFQFIGHKMEGRKPSFFEDIQYLWVGPLFVFDRLFRKLGLRF